MTKTAAQTVTLEAALPIGRPAPSKAFKTCSRCKGTGWWQFARKCFKCGGRGYAEVVTLATQIRDKKAHIVEVRGIIADGTARLATMRFGRKQAEERLRQDGTMRLAVSASTSATVAIAMDTTDIGC